MIEDAEPSRPCFNYPVRQPSKHKNRIAALELTVQYGAFFYQASTVSSKLALGHLPAQSVYSGTRKGDTFRIDACRMENRAGCFCGCREREMIGHERFVYNSPWLYCVHKRETLKAVGKGDCLCLNNKKLNWRRILE